MIPPALQEILALFQGVTEAQRREILTGLAASAGRWQPREGESFDFSEVRKDTECSDAAGVHLRREPGGGLRVRVSLGPEVQTLTRALAAALCQGLDGCRAEEMAALPESVVTSLAGAELVRLRSRSVYYLLRRLKEAAAQVSRDCA